MDLDRKIFPPVGSNGEWLDNKNHGTGTQVWKKTDVIYEGEWESGEPHGHGSYFVLTQESKGHTRKYISEWKHGKKTWKRNILLQ